MSLSSQREIFADKTPDSMVASLFARTPGILSPRRCATLIALPDVLDVVSGKSHHILQMTPEMPAFRTTSEDLKTVRATHLHFVDGHEYRCRIHSVRLEEFPLDYCLPHATFSGETTESFFRFVLGSLAQLLLRPPTHASHSLLPPVSEQYAGSDSQSFSRSTHRVRRKGGLDLYRYSI